MTAVQTVRDTLAPPASGVVRARGRADDVARLQMELTAQIVTLAAALERVPRGSVSAYVRAAGRDILRVRRCLRILWKAADEPRTGPLLAPDAPLAAYVRGTHAWCAAVARALVQLLDAEHAPAPDLQRALERLVGVERGRAFAAFEREVGAARWHALAELEPAVRRHWATLRRGALARSARDEAVASLGHQMDELFVAVARLADAVDVAAARRRLGAPQADALADRHEAPGAPATSGAFAVARGPRAAFVPPS